MEGLWTDLGGGDPAIAYKALWALAGAGPEPVKFLGGKLLEQCDAQEADRLIRDLDDDSWRVREGASAKLHKMGNLVAVALTRAQAQTASLETKARLAKLIETLPGKGKDDPSQLRVERALQALEIIGSPDAMEILKRFDRKPRDADELKKEYDEQHKKKPAQ
jgi:hypothetical protein